MLLKYTETVDADTGAVTASAWTDITPIILPFTGRRQIVDWSWTAFRHAYGYPILSEIYCQRLVFASTAAQPQSLWMSKTDDLNNFDTGTQDDSSLALTLSTTAQNEICWLMAHSSRLLIGTADAEYIITSGNAAALTHAAVRVENHGYVGSSPVPAIMAVDKVLYCERGGGRLYHTATTSKVIPTPPATSPSLQTTSSPRAAASRAEPSCASRRPAPSSP